MAHTFEGLTDLLARIDAAADEAAWNLANHPDAQAERLLEDALDRFGAQWRGDAAEFAARRAWLRSEILRRQPRVGRA